MRDGFAVHTAEGVLGGVLGTLLIRQTMALGKRMPPELTPPVPSRDPADLMVSRVESIAGRRFSSRVHEGLAKGLQWAYGIGWGGLLGIAVSGLHVRRPRHTLLAGAGMGALVWAVGYLGWLPRAGVLPPLRRQGVGHVATSLLTHVAYGVAAAVPILAIDEVRRRRRPPWQRLLDRAEELALAARARAR
jgi:GNAT superfamily N-acetyltransferase